MEHALTQERFEQFMGSFRESLKGDFTTKQDFVELRLSFSELQSSVDRYLQFTEAWHQELVILKSRQDRLAQVLINKGVVSEKEVALLG
ncbi:MAG: hypothetical protein AAB619_00145 [Patescibacteria group bacterium]